ncbi:MAG TPA: amidohydrolase family protein [Bryobacteraceae bacterium]|nr:amidohydrolase family protein [Bryobacteraceae bacterium]
MNAKVGTDGDDRLVIVSIDSHASPRFEDLRPYCPAAYVDDLGRYMSQEQAPANIWGESPGRTRRHQLNDRTLGHFDMAARLSDMDTDGIAAELMFHGSFSRDPFPFQLAGLRGPTIVTSPSPRDLELTLIGIQTYNRWLAASCSEAPDRLLGLAHVPTWSVDAAISEVRSAVAAGIRIVNWPSMPPPDVPQYDDPAWEPFWEVVEESGVVLDTHGGTVIPGFRYDLPHSLPLVQVEVTWPSRRGTLRMIFAGVFERFPGIKIVLTEQPGRWWREWAVELDSSWMSAPPALRSVLPNPPSVYMQRNVFIGGSFMASFEAADAVAEESFVENMMWGRDYPHREGTWAYTEDPDEPNRTFLALRDTFADIDFQSTAKMVGSNAVKLFGLDESVLAEIAQRIGAPTNVDIHRPLTAAENAWVARYKDHSYDYTSAFRKFGAWA